MLDPEWYRIPQYDGYHINIKTQDIRSFKNFNADPYHIMVLNKNGAVTLYRDDGKRVTRKPEYFYDLTFNSGNNPDPVPTNGVYMGGRQKMSKSQSEPIQMDFTKFMTK